MLVGVLIIAHHVLLASSQVLTPTTLMGFAASAPANIIRASDMISAVADATLWSKNSLFEVEFERNTTLQGGSSARLTFFVNHAQGGSLNGSSLNASCSKYGMALVGTPWSFQALVSAVPQPQEPNDVSFGAREGIVVGVICAVVVTIAAVLILRWRRRVTQRDGAVSLPGTPDGKVFATSDSSTPVPTTVQDTGPNDEDEVPLEDR